MFQEITQIAEPENIEKAINFGAMFWNFGLMLLGSILLVSGFAFKTKDTPVATMPWIRGNMRRFVVGGVLMVSLAVAMVLVPDQIETILGALAIDAKNATAPFLLGVGFGFALISVTSEPSKNPEG